MGSEGLAAIGAWEDIPRRNYEADVTAVKLDNREVFVLTRIDGQSTVSDLNAMSGFEAPEFLKILARLVTVELIQIDPSSAERTPLDQPQKKGGEEATEGPALGRRLKRKRRERPQAAPFRGVAQEDIALLQRFGPLGFIPGQPYAEPGTGRYGRFEFERKQLLDRCDLTIAERKEILFLSANLDVLDHFEFFNMQPTDDRKVLKRAFFRFNKRYHPDAYFRRNAGRYGPMVESLFKHGSDLHEVLQANVALRETYARAVTARDEAYRGDLEQKRDVGRQALRHRQQRQAAQRKIALRERLERNTRQRRQGGANPIAQQLAKAERFYETGMAAYESERFLSAATSLKLAMTYDPKNDSYRLAWEKVSEKAQQVKGDTLWKQGYMEESIGRRRDALAKYLQCVEVFPKPEYCARTAELMLDLGEDLHRASELAKIAVDADGENVDNLILLARVYDQVKLKKKALAVLQRAQKLDPKNERLKKTLRAVKRR